MRDRRRARIDGCGRLLAGQPVENALPQAARRELEDVPDAGVEQPLDGLLVVRVPGERPGDARCVQRQRDAGDHRSLGEPSLDLDREPPALRRARLEQRQCPAGAERLAAARRQQCGGAAVQHRLGRRHRDDEVGLDERRIDAQRHVRRRVRGRRDRRPRRRARSRARGNAAGTRVARAGRSRAALSVATARRRRGSSPGGLRAGRARRRQRRSPRGAGRTARPGSAATAARSRSSQCRRASRAPRAARPPSGNASASRTAAPTSSSWVRAGGGRRHEIVRRRLGDDDPASRRAAGCASRAAVRRRGREPERDEDPAGREPAEAGDRAAAAQPAGEGIGEQGVGGVRAERDQRRTGSRGTRSAARPSRVSGSTNCGRNARKKSAVFGLRTLTTTPLRVHLLQRCRLASRRAPPPRRASRIRRIPTTIRYAAPTSFTTVNAVADDATAPRARPSRRRRARGRRSRRRAPRSGPARRPLSTLWVTM